MNASYFSCARDEFCERWTRQACLGTATFLGSSPPVLSSGEIADFFPPTPVPSFLLVLAVANAPARSLLLQPLLPDPLWSTDRTVEKDTRAVASNEAIAVSSNLRSTPIPTLSPWLYGANRHDSSPFIQHSSPFVLLKSRRSQHPVVRAHSPFRASLCIPFSQWRPLFSRRASHSWFRSVARYCRNAVLPSIPDEITSSFYSHRSFRRSFSTSP